MKKACVVRLFLIFGVIGTWQNVEAISLSTFTGAANAVMQKAKPVVTFFSTFSRNFISALKNTDYNDRSIMIQVPPAKGNQGQTSYAIGYDFGFRGAGDAQQPFGFMFDSFGRYRVRPMNAMLYPGFIPDITDPSGQRKMPLSLSDGVAPQLIQSVLSFVLGSRSAAEKAWKPVAYFLNVSPESMFFLKMMLLVNSAQRNTIVKNGVASGKYPSVSDIPYEMMQLIFRLVITPDIQETKKLNEGVGVEKSYLWTKVATLSRPSKLLAKFPSFFVEALNVIKPAIAEAEVQEYKDRFNVSMSDLQRAYSQVRTVFPYEKRVEFIKNNIIGTFDPKKMTKTDVELYEYMIRQVVVERYRGLKTFITAGSQDAQKADTESGISDSSLNSSFANDSVVFVDVDRLMNFLSARIPKIKDFILFMTSSPRKGGLSSGLVSYLNGIGSVIEREFTDLSKLTADLTTARKIVASSRVSRQAAEDEPVEEATTDQSISQAIIEKLDAISIQESVELGTANLKKTKVPFMAYLDIKFWQAMRMMRQNFRGDKDFMYDDTSLSVEKAVVQAYAILCRANDDLMYLENLIKSNPQKFLLKDQKGDTISISGKEIYKQYTDVERYLLYTSQQLSSYRATLGKMTVEQQRADQKLIKLTTDNDNAINLYGKMRRVLRGYLRQFQFDRRMPRAKKAGRVALGDAVVLGMGDVNVIEINADSSEQAPAQVSSTSSTGVTPKEEAAQQEDAEQDGLQNQEDADTQSTTPADDPFAVFGSGVTAESDQDSISSDELEAQEAGAIPPVLDSPFAAKGSDTQTTRGSAKNTALGVSPDAYGYPRTVDAFIQEEFAKLVLRCPTFKKFAETKLASSINGVIGMDVSTILTAAAGLQSDIQVQEDAAFLPDESFFSSSISLSVSDKKPTAAEMSALGKSLHDQYANLLEEDGAGQGEAAEDEVVIEDFKSSDFENLVTLPQSEKQEIDGALDLQEDNLTQRARNTPAPVSAGDDDLAGLFDDDSTGLNSSDSDIFGVDMPVEENAFAGTESAAPVVEDNQEQITEGAASSDGGDPDLAAIFN
ncbi:hypothetical protein FJ366_02240 [Candidatus Dependentiae bacterium]|nr:hypothetical protein [Candidatus Dependentiae bacterium]